MGKKNKILKLTPRKIRYIIRYKTNSYSTKSIAKDLKISQSTVKESRGFDGRDHSLSLVHLDWHVSNFNGKEVCVVLDDSSRRILVGGEFDAETTENSVKHLQEALDSFGWLKSIRQVMTDHGTQFYANKRDKNRYADSRFENFLRMNKIVHILSPIKRPQVNGKIEKWND